MLRLPPRSTLSSSSAASDVYKRQRHMNMMELELGAPTVLQVCWSVHSIQQTWRVVQGIMKHAIRSPLDNEDAVGAALRGLRVDIVNLWPTCGLLNRTGASTGWRLNSEWSCPTQVLMGMVFAVWFLLTFDMIAAIAGLVYAISFGLDCTLWNNSAIYISGALQYCPSGWVLFTSVVPLAVVCVVIIPALLHAMWRYWSRTFAIVAGLVAWGMSLWYGDFSVWEAVGWLWDWKHHPDPNATLVILFGVNVWGIVTALSNFCRGNMYSTVLSPPIKHRIVVNNLAIALIGFNGAAVLLVTLLITPGTDPSTCTDKVQDKCQRTLLLLSGSVRLGFFSICILQLVVARCTRKTEPTPQERRISVHTFDSMDAPLLLQPLKAQHDPSTGHTSAWFVMLSGSAATGVYMLGDAGIWIIAHYRYTGYYIPWTLTSVQDDTMRCGVCQMTRTNIFFGVCIGAWFACVFVVELWVLLAQWLQQRQKQRNLELYSLTANELRLSGMSSPSSAYTAAPTVLLYPKYNAPAHEWQAWIQANKPPSMLRGITDADSAGWAAAISAAREQCYGRRHTQSPMVGAVLDVKPRKESPSLLSAHERLASPLLGAQEGRRASRHMRQHSWVSVGSDQNEEQQFYDVDPAGGEDWNLAAPAIDVADNAFNC
eukprot:TRINITY_DN17358_c0_g1_i2.p1 TRINITY_DN17358_c0_g1~~TRINITY_DN17358_c0_g1_i2.p1  ORF type:complete len:654 (+),score=160.38 TRINITY_DN17358_c0_g1_i2:114-2075(+)